MLRPGLIATFLLLLSSGYTHTSAGQKELKYRRIYTPGDQYGYELRVEQFQNGQAGSSTEARSRHTIVSKPNRKERIRWERLIRRSGDQEQDLAKAISELPDYYFSAAHNARKKDREMPSFKGLDQPLVGAIADLQTFLLASSPAVGTHRLRKVGDKYKSKETQVGSWANGTTVLVGQDCIQITVELTKLTKDHAAFTTTFSEPKVQCKGMKPLPDFAKAPVDPEITFNNFQQILAAGDRLHIMWGRERFVVKSIVRRSDGKILSGRMDNHLELKMKVGCDKNLSNCTGSMPLRLYRKLILTPAK